jgi:hypothetical protein
MEGVCNTLFFVKKIKPQKIFIELNNYDCCIHEAAYFVLC